MAGKIAGASRSMATSRVTVAKGGGSVDPAISQSSVKNRLNVLDKGDLSAALGRSVKNSALHGEVIQEVVKRDEVRDPRSEIWWPDDDPG